MKMNAIMTSLRGGAAAAAGTLMLLMLMMVTLLSLTKGCLAQDVQGYLSLQNNARAEVGEGPFAWDAKVASYAQSYANSRRGDCALIHSNGPYGENIFWGGAGYDWKASDAATLWVKEKPYYNYASNSCVGGECGHYTQVVWSKSTHIGCASVKCDDGGTFITCNYDPPGNYVGERPYPPRRL